MAQSMNNVECEVDGLGKQTVFIFLTSYSFLSPNIFEVHSHVFTQIAHFTVDLFSSV